MLGKILRALAGGNEAPSLPEALFEAVSGMNDARLGRLRRSGEAEAEASVRRSDPAPATDVPPPPFGSAPPPPPPQPGKVTVPEFRHSSYDVNEPMDARAKRLLPTVLGVENKAVREYLIDRARNDDPVWNDERRTRDEQALDRALGSGDAIDIALDLYARLPARRGLPNPEGELRRLNHAFDTVHRAAWKKVGHEPAFTDAQLRKALTAMGALIASGVDDYMSPFDYHYRTIVMAAAVDQWPKWKRALADTLSAGFKGDTYRHSDVVKLVERLLEDIPLERADIPELVAVDEANARLDSIRGAIARDLHPVAAAALFALLDAGSTAMHAKLAELNSLRTLSAEERGDIFADLVRVLPNPARYGLGTWGQLQKEKGAYRYGIKQSEMPFQLGALFLALTRRVIALPDADATLAGTFALLEKLTGLSDRKFLGVFLDTAKQHPQGQTAAQLRRLIAAPGAHHPFKEFRVEIEDALRFLPSGPQTQSAPAASPLEGLPPLPLPKLDLDSYSPEYDLRLHFENLFDARLYDDAHRGFIKRLAGLHVALQTHHDTGGDQSHAALARLVAANGFPGVRFNIWSLINTARLGAQLDQRLEVYAPFVTAYPEQARRLSTLTAAARGEVKPTKAWLKDGHYALRDVPHELVASLMDRLMEKPIDTVIDMRGDAALRTLVLVSSGLDPALFSPRLATFALKHCYAKERGVGMRDERMGNACIIALSEMPAGAGIASMARVQNRVNYPKVKRFIDKRFEAAAKAAKITRGELDELVVPVHGLDESSCLTQAIGDGRGMARIDGGKLEVTWVAANGAEVKSPSAGMKADAAALKAFRAQVAEIKADIAVQTARLQRLYLENRDWPLDQWRRRYAEHPLLGALAQRLVWWVGTAGADAIAVMPEARGTVLRGLDGEPVTPDPAARVRLWHPIEASLQDIEAWRDRLEQEAMQQPFAQVWREVYLLTDAERTTHTYTNRWSGHILRQHQTMELARANGWSATHQTGFDSSRSTPWQLPIPAHGLVASYWVEGLRGAAGDGDFSPGGAFTYITTDRMLFHAMRGGTGRDANRAYEGETIALETLPPIVFSEVMRCGDLFTAIASIGNDPEWIDRGADADAPNDWRRRTNVYWRDTNAAPLEQSGQSRRAILERIIPRLKIADRLSLDDRFLHVRGKLNAYSIHLGAGGAFCGTRHLCIVPSGEGPTGKIWLPFEGDRILSLILSKALLLAADDKITDPVILAQIR
jgi:hypothetical protein